ncbi:MAG: hypothetical protein NTY19_08275 [Planctomycetota bacterium]|nr:hypothetical protein [Planctomycetota bacterium]
MVLDKVYDEVLKAVSEKGGRVLVQKSVRSLLNLSLTEAEGEIARVRQKAKGGQVTRINVSGVIEE